MSTHVGPSRPAGNTVRIDEDVVKFDGGSCEELSKASMKCIEDMGYDKQAAAVSCKKHFDAYKECRKAQNLAKRAANQAQAVSIMDYLPKWK